MKLIFYEIKKVISQKVFITVIFLLLILNCFLIIYTQLSGPQSNEFSQLKQYNDTISGYLDLPGEEALAGIEDKLLAFDILSDMEALVSSDDVDFTNSIYEEIKAYKQENPKAYAEAESMSKSGGDYTEEREILQEIHAQLEYIKSYPSFINEMDERAESQSKAKLFNNENSFSYKNLFKTADDYRILKNAELKLGSDKVALAVGNFQITDYFIIAVLFLVCVYLFSAEREKGLYNLVRSAKRGRLPTILSKLAALVIFSVAVSMIFTILNFISAGFVYGADSLNNQIQSFSEFRNCALNITLRQYGLIFVLSKAFNVLAFSFIFALIFVCLSGALTKYLCCGAAVGLEYAMYAFIPADSPVSFLKHINVFYFTDSQKLLSKYLNINIFGEPVNIFTIDIFTVALIVLVSSAAVLIYFTFKNQSVKSGKFNALSYKFKSKFYKINGSTSLMRGEAFKYLVQHKAILVFSAIAVFSLMNCAGKETYVYHSKADYIYQKHMQYLEGEITPEKVRYISEKEQYITKLEKKLNDENISDGMTDVIQNMIENETQALNKVKNQYDRLRSIQSSGAEAEFIDENIYSHFICDSQREWVNLVLVCLLLIITIPSIYTDEYKNNVIRLLRPTENGKLRLWLCKVTMGILACSLVFILVYAPYLVRFINGFKASSLATSVQLIEMFKASTGLSVINAFIIEHLAYMFIAVAVFSVVTFISVFSENNLVAMILSSVVIIIPAILINGNESIRVGRIFCIGWQIPLILILAFCVVIMLISLIASGGRFTQTKLLQRKY